MGVVAQVGRHERERGQGVGIEIVAQRAAPDATQRHVVGLARRTVGTSHVVGGGVVFHGVPARGAQVAVARHGLLVAAGRPTLVTHLTKEVVAGDRVVGRGAVVGDAVRRAGRRADVVGK